MFRSPAGAMDTLRELEEQSSVVPRLGNASRVCSRAAPPGVDWNSLNAAAAKQQSRMRKRRRSLAELRSADARSQTRMLDVPSSPLIVERIARK